MAKIHNVNGFVDGHLRSFRMHSPVDEASVERLLKLSVAPYGGIYIIHHTPSDIEGRDFFREFKEKNPGKKAYVGYTTFETDSIPAPWVESCNLMDEIWVPSHFNIETFSRAGVQREKLHVIPHGFDPSHYQSESTEPLQIGEKKGFDFLSIFEWTYRKGWDVLIKAYIEEFKADEDVRLILRTYQGGGIIGKKAVPIIDQLTNFIVSLGHDPCNIPDIEILDNIVPAELMPGLYKSADTFILPTRGEGWGIPLTESMLMEVPVIATRWSAQTEFMNDDNSYLIDVDAILPVSDQQVKDNPLYEGHQWAEPSVQHTKKLMRKAFENRHEAREKGRIAKDHILNNFTIHHAAIKIADRLINLDKISTPKKVKKNKSSDFNILFQARPNIFTMPGGDTDVMIHLKKSLEESGLNVDFNSNSSADLSEYDIVHILNFDQSFALNAAMQKKPYIVTPMYEDIQKYYLTSMGVIHFFDDYVDSRNFGEIEKALAFLRNQKEIAVPMEYDFIATNAEAILVSGESERDCIKRDFPPARNIHVVHLGFNRPEDHEHISPGMFEDEFGVKDFVLCVGRLESRKNQLLLQYALRNDDVPLVFVNSRTVQPEYEELCLKFKRKGKTIFTGRLPAEMLYSAFSAARVHALPSWYELPGIVSLEAAWWGCNIVTSDWGTIRDYLGDKAFYCDPDDPDSIRSAVLSALESQPDRTQTSELDEYTWEKEAGNILSIYKKVLASCRSIKGIRRLRSKVEAARQELAFQQSRRKSHKLLQSDPDGAYEIASKLLQERDLDPTLYFIKGTARLFQMNYKEAGLYLARAIELQPLYELKGYLYLSLSLMKQGKSTEAADVLLTCLRRNPFQYNETKVLVHEYLIKAHEDAGNDAGIRDAKNRLNRCRNEEEIVRVS